MEPVNDEMAECKPSLSPFSTQYRRVRNRPIADISSIVMVGSMKIRRPLGATYKGMLFFGAAGGAAFATLSALLFVFRAQCEPILRLLLPLLAGRRGHYQYDPDSYYFWAWLAAAMSLLWMGLVLWAALRKPHEDRRLDKHLKAKLSQKVRGAPLEPG
ncbi:hypothetical protein H9L12_09460 [Sphingomonas rhizophila]|uniref:Uncharacterized protein n=1 Tax=Sphingomonas rhizophila TaxID=2071607 RepID=A0A7G9S9K8_9SPHN|nr:hypothetical protein [Sphingomonas rhizophila]QNN64533.1 hypothetical protein H9L12_09460 [Sphingomonas rhizophila]